MWLVFVVGESRKKSAPFCGGCIDLMGSYHSRKIAIFLLGFLRLLMSSWKQEQFGLPGFGTSVFYTRGGFAFD